MQRRPSDNLRFALWLSLICLVVFGFIGACFASAIDSGKLKKAHYCEVSSKYRRTAKDSLYYELRCP